MDWHVIFQLTSCWVYRKMGYHHQSQWDTQRFKSLTSTFLVNDTPSTLHGKVLHLFGESQNILNTSHNGRLYKPTLNWWDKVRLMMILGPSCSPPKDVHQIKQPTLKMPQDGINVFHKSKHDGEPQFFLMVGSWLIDHVRFRDRPNSFGPFIHILKWTIHKWIPP